MPTTTVLRVAARSTRALRCSCVLFIAFIWARRFPPDSYKGGGYTVISVRSRPGPLMRTSP
eukprot:9502387-Pyramimonas_sp.AAC.1